MEDVLEVYQRAYDASRPLVCLDEASKQLVAETRKAIPVEPGKLKRVDAEYRRCGTASVFMLNAPLEGQRHVRVRDAEKIVLVMDNLNTHNLASLYVAFEPAEARRLAKKLEIHYTPKHGSWLDMAEMELSVLARQCLGQYFETRHELAEEIRVWQEQRNAGANTVNWQFTAADARIELEHLCPEILT